MAVTPLQSVYTTSPTSRAPAGSQRGAVGRCTGQLGNHRVQAGAYCSQHIGQVVRRVDKSGGGRTERRRPHFACKPGGIGHERQRAAAGQHLFSGVGQDPWRAKMVVELFAPSRWVLTEQVIGVSRPRRNTSAIGALGPAACMAQPGREWQLGVAGQVLAAAGTGRLPDLALHSDQPARPASAHQ
jgi:hypothetical protein